MLCSAPSPRCADGEQSRAATLGIVAWALWLGAPVAATALAAIWSWWRGVRARGPRRVSTLDAMRAHSDYLDALAIPARNADRGQRAADDD